LRKLKSTKKVSARERFPSGRPSPRGKNTAKAWFKEVPGDTSSGGTANFMGPFVVEKKMDRRPRREQVRAGGTPSDKGEGKRYSATQKTCVADLHKGPG